MIIKNSQELQKIIDSCRQKYEDRVNSKTIKSIHICGGTACLNADSKEILAAFEQLIKEHHLEEKVSVNIVGCFRLCSKGPFVKILPSNTFYTNVTPNDAKEIFESDIIGNKIVERLLYVDTKGKKLVHQEDITFYKKQMRMALHGCGDLNPENIEETFAFDGYKGLAVALGLDSNAVIKEVSDAGLRGRGGAGFPTGTKWRFAHDQVSDEKYMICNADEGDPGAFMDESIMEGNPHAVLEGLTIAAYAIGAHKGYIYIRAEYPNAIARLQIAIKQAHEWGLLGKNILGSGFDFDIELRYGAGAFVCGEETALLQSIEGKRGMPRSRPPYPAVKGLWGKPTVINNVESLALLPFILRNGAAAFNSVGTEKSKGTKVFALGGKVNNVGLVEVPMGTTLRELIYDIGEGIPNGKKFKAIQTGGPSGGCLTAEDLDTPIDYDTLTAAGSMMGSGGAIVMDEDNCMVDVAKFYMEFICDESCGKCTPCRIGNTRNLEILEKITSGKGEMSDLDELVNLAAYIKEASLCALGQTAANPILSTLRKFKDEYVAHIVDKKCPAHVCKNLMEYHIDAEKCKKCGLCAKSCPVQCIHGEVGKKAFEIDQSKCIKCGTCISTCPFGVISKR